MRFEASFSRSATATDGDARDSSASEAAAFGVRVHCAGRDGVVGRGFTGVEVGRLALRKTKLAAALRIALNEALDRGRADLREKLATLKLLGAKAASLIALDLVEPSTERDDVAATYSRDPRVLDRGELNRTCREASAAIGGLGDDVAFNAVSALAELRHELFVNSAGALISQAFAFAQGDCYVVAQTADGHQETWDAIGDQRGFETLAEGSRDELAPHPDLHTFALELGKETRELAAAPALKPPDEEVVVVTDPALQLAGRPRDRRPSVRSGPRAQDGSRLCGP